MSDSKNISGSPDDRRIPGLASNATVRDRVKALVALGVSIGEIADAVGVASSETIRTWASEDGRIPHRENEVLLDDLRFTALLLLDGYESGEVASWLRSRARDLGGDSPLTVFAHDPARVIGLAAADALAERNKRQPPSADPDDLASVVARFRGLGSSTPRRQSATARPGSRQKKTESAKRKEAGIAARNRATHSGRPRASKSPKTVEK